MILCREAGILEADRVEETDSGKLALDNLLCGEVQPDQAAPDPEASNPTAGEVGADPEEKDG